METDVKFCRWERHTTEKDYLTGSTIANIPLGEGAYGLIIVTPCGDIHLEEVPIYGGEPVYYRQWYGSLKEAIEFIRKEWR